MPPYATVVNYAKIYQTRIPTKAGPAISSSAAACAAQCAALPDCTAWQRDVSTSDNNPSYCYTYIVVAGALFEKANSESGIIKRELPPAAVTGRAGLGWQGAWGGRIADGKPCRKAPPRGAAARL